MKASKYLPANLISLNSFTSKCFQSALHMSVFSGWQRVLWGDVWSKGIFKLSPRQTQWHLLLSCGTFQLTTWFRLWEFLELSSKHRAPPKTTHYRDECGASSPTKGPAFVTYLLFLLVLFHFMEACLFIFFHMFLMNLNCSLPIFGEFSHVITQDVKKQLQRNKFVPH